MKKNLLKTSVLLTCLMAFNLVSQAQLLQQDFSSSTTVSTYANATTPSNGQFNTISTSGAGTVLSINTTTSNKLRFARTSNAGSFSRTTDFSPTPTSMMYRFDLTVSGNSTSVTNLAAWQVGSGFGTANSTEANSLVHSRIGLNWTTTAGQFSLRDIGASANSANFTGTQTITWVINNSGAPLSYRAPDGTEETVGNDAFDLWIGTTKSFNESSATTASQTLTDLKFAISGGVGNVDMDNFLIDPIPSVPTSGAATSITSSSFQANWTAVSGVTGYRVDVATDAAFTSLVSGYNNLYVSGQSTNSLSVTGLSPVTTYYYRVRAASQYTVGEFAGGNSGSQNLTTASAGAPSLSISGTPTNHGSSCLGIPTSTVTYTITNAGTAASGVAVNSSDAQFVVSNLSSTSIAGSGGTATYDVTFTPASGGAQSATITVSSTTSGSNSPTSALTGTGLTAVSPVVSSATASSVVNTLATLNGTLTTLGTCPNTIEKGFVYSETGINSDPLAGGSGVTKTSVAGLTTGAFLLNLTGLSTATGYSYKAYTFNGTTYTYGSVETFTTLSPADHLAFGTAPAGTGNVGANLAAFTVEARRADNSVDAEYTGTINLSRAIVSGGGNLAGTFSLAATAGVATFSAVQFDNAGTFTLTATSGALTSTTSGNIVVSLAPVTLYQHDFGTTTISGYPYNVAPGVLASNLSNSSWTNNNSTNWTSFAGNSGQALSLSSITSTNQWTLSFDVAYGYQVAVSAFDFWVRTSQATTTWTMSINGISVGSGSGNTTGVSIGQTNVANAVAGLTGTVNVLISISGTGSFRVDDFTLIGNVTPAPPVISGFSPTTGYLGSTVVIAGDYFTGATAVTFGGTSAASFTVDNAQQITAVVAAGSSGTVQVTTPNGTATSAGSFTYGGYITAQDGDWNTGSTWLNGSVPPAGETVTIAHNVTLSSSFNNTGSVTVNAGASLATAATYTNSGSTTVSGTFQIDQGGWATGNNFVYDSPGTLAFNNTSGSYGVNNDVFWPSSNGPENVNVNGAGGITMNVSRTVTGIFQTVAGVSGTALTLNGSALLNAGGYFNTAPTYGASSTLIYNTSYGTFNEWTGGASTSPAAGTGVPANVTVLSGTLSLGANRGLPGNITVGNGATLNLNSGDLYVGGDFTQDGTLTNNSKAVFFVGSAATQTISATGGTVFFDYFIIDKAAGAVQLSSSTPTNLTLNATAGSVLQLLNSGSLDLNGRTLSFNNNGGSILVNGGARSISSSVSGGLIAVTGSKTVSSVSGGSLSLGANVTVETSAGIDFGSGVTTINGTFKLDAGGFASSSPVYGSGSSLVYTTGDYSTSNEWTAGGSVGAGVPDNITINLASGTNSLTLTGARTVPGNIDLANGNVVIGANTLTLNGAVSRTSGNLAGSNSSNLVIGGTAGTLYFDGSGTNNYLKNFTINNGASATLGNALNITAGASANTEGLLTVSGTGVLTTGGFLTIKSNVNGSANIAPGNTAGGYISGNVTVERYVPQNSSKAWRLIASNTTGQTINAAWQEGAVGAMVDPVPGFGTKITSPGANLAAVQANGFDTLSNAASIYSYDADNDVLVAVPNTNATNLEAHPGYFIFVRGDRSPGQFGASAPTTSTVLRSNGSLFEGDQAAVSTGASDWGMVRNPYPSRIDMRNIVQAGSLVDAFQVWDAKLGGSFGVGGYQTFVKSGSDYIVSPGGGSYGTIGSINNFIESGAAFIIQSSGGSGSAQVTEACKATSSTNNSFRPSDPLSGNQRLTYNLYANNAGGSVDLVDGGLVFFDNSYSNAVDVYDVRKSTNFNENLGMLRNSVDLAIERRQLVGAADTVFLNMSQMRQLSYRIDISTNEIDPLITTAYLEDKFTGASTPLDLSGAVNSYVFTIGATAASKVADRFRIVFRQSTVVPVRFTSLSAGKTGNDIAVQWKVGNQVNISKYEVEKSADGRNFTNIGTVIAGTGNVYNWLDQNVFSGNNYYRIKSVDNGGAVQYSSIVKVTGVKNNSLIAVSPNPVVAGGVINLQFEDQPAGKYAIRLINIAGQVVYNTNLQHIGGSVSQSFALPSALVSGVYQLQVIAPGSSVHNERLIVNAGN